MSREVRRVPLSFAWPLKKVWQGYLRPERLRLPDCTACDGSGGSPRARELHNLWYGYVPFHPRDNGSLPLTPADSVVSTFATRNVDRDPQFYIGRWYSPDIPHAEIERQCAITRECRRLCKLWNGSWSHHLNQDDVDALLADGRLMDLTHTFDPVNRWQPKDPPVRPSAVEVNAWSLRGLGHDSINSWSVIRARLAREGAETTCSTCHGEGDYEAWEGQRVERESWTPTQPPTGDGWQLWETTTEGAPVGPVFPNPDALAGWLTTAEGGAAVGFGDYSEPMTWEQARGFVKAGSTVGSMISVGDKVYDSAAYIGAQVAAEDQS